MARLSDSDDISANLSLLLDSVREEEQYVQNEGIKAMHDGQYNTATSIIGFAQQLRLFQGEVETLISKWKKLEGIREEVRPASQAIVREASPPAVKRGWPPKSDDYCRHILEALVKMGGHGQTADVSAAVNKMVKMRYPQLREARATMVRSGQLLEHGSHGELRITDNGRNWLKSLNDVEHKPTGESEVSVDVAAPDCRSRATEKPPSGGNDSLEKSAGVKSHWASGDFDQI